MTELQSLEALMLVAGSLAAILLLFVALLGAVEAARRWAPGVLPTWIRDELDREHARAEVLDLPWVAGCRGCEAASYVGRPQLARHQAVEHGIVRLESAA